MDTILQSLWNAIKDSSLCKPKTTAFIGQKSLHFFFLCGVTTIDDFKKLEQEISEIKQKKFKIPEDQIYDLSNLLKEFPLISKILINKEKNNKFLSESKATPQQNKGKGEFEHNLIADKPPQGSKVDCMLNGELLEIKCGGKYGSPFEKGSVIAKKLKTLLNFNDI